MQLNNLMQTAPPELVFLDIEMPYLSGLDLLATLQSPPCVIITSAYEKYALLGYEFDVTDYLLKPIPFERFLKAVNKARQTITQRQALEQPAADFIFVQSGKCMHRVRLCDILFVEGMENYVCIYTDNGRLTVRSTFRHITESLPDRLFMQIHKSYLVNMERISMMEGNSLRVGNHNIPIARNYRDEMKRRIMEATL